MKVDAKGLEVTTGSGEVVGAINHFGQELLSQGKDIGAIYSFAEQHPDCAFLQALAASLSIFSQTTDSVHQAAPFLRRAQENLSQITEREKLFIQAVEAGCQKEFAKAVRWHEKILTQWPQDRVSAKLAEFHLFELGQGKRQLEIMQALSDVNRDDSHVYSMYAFALELNGQFDASREAVDHCLELDPHTPWAHHCLAHIYLNSGLLAEGIKGLEQSAPTWATCNVYIQSHVGFHLAMLHAANLDPQAALQVYRGKIQGFDPESVFEHTDTILLLWTLELANFDVTPEWKNLIPKIKKNAQDQVFPFLNALYVYALVRAGKTKEAKSSLEGVVKFSQNLKGEAKKVWTQIGVPIIRGCYHFAREEYDLANEFFAGTWWRSETGGSDEQRIPIVWSYFVSLLRSKQSERGRRELNNYVGSRKLLPIESLWLKG